MRRHAPAVALTLLVLAGAGAPAAGAEGSLSIGLVDPPRDPSDPRAAQYIVERVAPGGQVVRRVRVSNGTTEQLAVSVYPGAAEVRAGTFTWSDGRAPNEVTRWTSVRPATATLDAGASAEVTVSIHVPDGVALGERYGVVWAELPRSGAGVVNRVGVRIYLTVARPERSRAWIAIAVVVLLVVAAAVIAAAARRRGTGHGDSTAASP